MTETIRSFGIWHIAFKQSLVSLILLIVSVFPGFVFAAPISGYCVLWLRTDRGIEVRGNAWDIVPNVSRERMTEGDVILTTEGPGHAAEIIGFRGENRKDGYIAPESIQVIENWLGVVRVREIPWDATYIRGIYRPLSPV